MTIYSSTEDCLLDLERNGHLVRITEPVDANLEMAAIHRRVYDVGGPALWFQNIKNCQFTAVSNLFGTSQRCNFLFRHTAEQVRALISLKGNPNLAWENPLRYWRAPFTALKALPKKVSRVPVAEYETTIEQLPQIKCWPEDGGAYITLPLVYSEDVTQAGIMHANLGMYRIQLSGNDYIPNREIGLHYQIHRGIGIHQAKANALGEPLRVSIFVGGTPAHIVSAVMPLPEGLSELTFAGALGGRRFRYAYRDGFCLSADADFVITGWVYSNETKPEGPFGDHLGYYSLTHPFPLMRVHKVYHRKNAIWPFTVVGRPPQEDTGFGELIHELTGDAIPQEIPGLHAVHAVDAAGVHPLLLAIGSERYTPYLSIQQPQELLTLANRVLGTGQLSLAKYLLIVAKEDNPLLDIHRIPDFFAHLLERVDWQRDLHFQTQTTMDTLDYSGTSVNEGSKVVIAAVGSPKRKLLDELPDGINLPDNCSTARVAMQGILVITAPPYSSLSATDALVVQLGEYWQQLPENVQQGFPLWVLADDSAFAAHSINNFLWVTFTRSNPSHDIYGINSFVQHKHWGCRGAMIIDARKKPHHAPPLLENEAVERQVDKLGEKGKSLYGII